MRMLSKIGGGRLRALALAVAAVLFAGGIAAIGVACGAQDTPPTVHPTPETSTAATPAAKGPVLPESKPVSVAVPAIDVHSKLQELGLRSDGTVEVPQMGPHYNEAGWYKYSPTPGEQGPAVILGHIDSAKLGPSVFFRLGDVKKGDTVKVTRADGTVAVFTADKIEQYPKSNFPTKKVYGDTPNAQLRLISCGGDFDESKRSYVDDIVVYAHLTGSHRA